MVGAGTFTDGVAVSPDGHSLYVATTTDSGASNVAQFDVGAGGALAPKNPATVPADFGAYAVAVRPTTIDDVIASVAGLGLPDAVENVLLTKLLRAQQSHDANDLAGTCHWLAAFIKQVMAQSPNKIPANDAQTLIDRATTASESLGCSRGAATHGRPARPPKSKPRPHLPK